MPDLTQLVSDLVTEQNVLDFVLTGIHDHDWDTPTPAEGWSVRDQVSHLAFFDEQAAKAIFDPGAFIEGLNRMARDPEEFIMAPLVKGRDMEPFEVHSWWWEARNDMISAFGQMDPGHRIPWFGPPLRAATFITARLMETWAHGQDVVDAVGARREPTNRLKHIVHLGVKSRPFSFEVRGLTPPDTDVYVQLAAPRDEVWTWGEPGPERVAGPAEDFCLVVTQRRHVADTNLRVEGTHATKWMEIAQVFAGPPGPGRRPGQFPRPTA